MRQPAPPEPVLTMIPPDYTVEEDGPPATVTRQPVPPKPVRAISPPEYAVEERIPPATVTRQPVPPEPVRAVSHTEKAIESPRERGPVPGSSAMDLKDLAHKLADFIWETEHSGQQSAEATILQYIQGVIVTELEYRRRMRDLDQRLAELENARRAVR
jgi:hypothetical protein